MWFGVAPSLARALTRRLDIGIRGGRFAAVADARRDWSAPATDVLDATGPPRSAGRHRWTRSFPRTGPRTERRLADRVARGRRGRRDHGPRNAEHGTAHARPARGTAEGRTGRHQVVLRFRILRAGRLPVRRRRTGGARLVGFGGWAEGFPGADYGRSIGARRQPTASGNGDRARRRPASWLPRRRSRSHPAGRVDGREHVRRDGPPRLATRSC